MIFKTLLHFVNTLTLYSWNISHLVMVHNLVAIPWTVSIISQYFYASCLQIYLHANTCERPK